MKVWRAGSRWRKCSFDTIYGRLDEYEIWAPRDVALKIEKQTRLQAQLGHTYLKMTSVYLKRTSTSSRRVMRVSKFNKEARSIAKLPQKGILISFLVR